MYIGVYFFYYVYRYNWYIGWLACASTIVTLESEVLDFYHLNKELVYKSKNRKKKDADNIDIKKHF